MKSQPSAVWRRHHKGPTPQVKGDTAGLSCGFLKEATAEATPEDGKAREDSPAPHPGGRDLAALTSLTTAPPLKPPAACSAGWALQGHPYHWDNPQWEPGTPQAGIKGTESQPC